MKVFHMTGFVIIEVITIGSGKGGITYHLHTITATRVADTGGPSNRCLCQGNCNAKYREKERFFEQNLKLSNSPYHGSLENKNGTRKLEGFGNALWQPGDREEGEM